MTDVKRYAEYYWFNRLTRGRRALQEELLRLFGSVPEFRMAWENGEVDIGAVTGEKSPEKTDPSVFMEEAVKVMNRASGAGIEVVCRDDPDYPALLSEYRHSPLLLFYEGDIGRINKCSSRISVVGSRKCTSYGREMCVKTVSALSGRNICVVSGMARGIDSFAHKAALDAGIFTAAVLGCGTDVIYPRENAGLYAKIKENGVIISEQPPGTQPLRTYFPARNRIIAGIAEATFVAEAGLSSGALITADFALDAGRDVLTIPHRIDTPEGAGCNDMLKNGALFVTSPMDVLRALGFDGGTAGASDVMAEALDKNQAEILTLIKRNGELFEDEIVSETSIPSQEIKRALSALEIFGFIKKDFNGGFYAV
ncbi:MAG: DNA-processing protein DprA [Clostridia bacterium]|nr:DNA-processing protein DprA [Clostridia bacterium]